MNALPWAMVPVVQLGAALGAKSGPGLYVSTIPCVADSPEVMESPSYKAVLVSAKALMDAP